VVDVMLAVLHQQRMRIHRVDTYLNQRRIL